MIAAASASLIYAGEPVMLVAGASTVLPNQTSNLLTVPSPYVPYATTGTGLLGIAETTSTNTASLAGYVDYVPVDSKTTYLITAKVSGTISTQSQYDALVGHRVLIDLTAGTYTGLIADSALNGCIIQPLNVVKLPGKIAFIFRDGVSASM
jgi:hypothetical protein